MNESGAGRPLSQATLSPGHPTTPTHAGPLRDSFEFLRGFVRHPAQVGSIVPSSHHLEQRLVRSARISEARTVVEFGPGTGGTTAAFLQVMSSRARLLAIELDPEFHQHLEISIPASFLNWAAPSDWRTFWPPGSCRRPMSSSPAFRFQPCRLKSRIGWPQPSPGCCRRAAALSPTKSARTSPASCRPISASPARTGKS